MFCRASSGYAPSSAGSEKTLKIWMWIGLTIHTLFVTALSASWFLAAHLYRADFFQPEHVALRRKVARIGLSIGLPLDGGLRLFASRASGLFTRYLSSTVVAFGVLALIAGLHVKRNNRLGAMGGALAAVGHAGLHRPMRGAHRARHVLAAKVPAGAGGDRYALGVRGAWPGWPASRSRISVSSSVSVGSSTSGSMPLRRFCASSSLFIGATMKK